MTDLCIHRCLRHMHFDNYTHVEIRNVTIWCDWRRQAALAGLPLRALPEPQASAKLPPLAITREEEELLAKWVEATMAQGGAPMLPFNTDGIDPGVGSNDVWIHNLTVENFDDVVAIKPCNGKCKETMLCTEDILVEDVTVFLGVGLSVGSVSPHTPTNCIRNITFRDARFDLPFKAIYVKTNSGDEGDGLIENIRYEDMVINKPFVWPVCESAAPYTPAACRSHLSVSLPPPDIGPQQQKVFPPPPPPSPFTL